MRLQKINDPIANRNIQKSLYETEQVKELPKVKKMIVEGKDLDSRVGKYGRTLLQEAAAKRQDKIVEALLGAHPLVDQRDERGQTALHIACKKGLVKIAEKLVEEKASKVSRDNQGNTPMMKLMTGGFEGEIDFLIEGDLDLPNKEGETPLHLAVSRGKESWIKALLNAGADPLVVDSKGRTCFERLFECQLPFKTFKTRYFIDGLKVTRKESAGEILEAFSRLNLRVQWSVKQVMKNLVRGLNPEAAKEILCTVLKNDPFLKSQSKEKDKFYFMGFALLYLKKREFRYDNVQTGEKMLISSKTEKLAPCAKLLLRKLEDWTPALQSLLKQNDPDEQFQTERKALLAELMKSEKVDFNRSNAQGVPLLHEALRNANGDFQFVEMLINAGKVDLAKAIDKEGNTVSDVAAEIGALTVLEALKKKGIKLPESSLKKAIMESNEDCIRFLVKNIEFSQLQQMQIEGLTLETYAVLFAPQGLKEALFEKGFDLRKFNPNTLKRTLKEVVLKDLKFYIQTTKINIAELNQLVRELAGDEPSTSLLFEELELGIDYFIRKIELQEKARAEKRSISGIPIPFGDYLSMRTAVREFVNPIYYAGVWEMIFKDIPSSFTKFFKTEQSLEGLAWAAKMTIPQKEPPIKESKSFKREVKRQYRWVNLE